MEIKQKVNLVVRELKKEDLPLVKKLAKKAFNGSRDSYWSIKNIKNCDKVFVAEVNGEVVGVVEIEFSTLSDGLHGQIGYIFVHPNYRGLGVASRLLEESIRYIKLRGAKHVWALTTSDNIATRFLFKSNGFSEISFKDMSKKLSKRDLMKLLRDMYYWPGDIIIYKKLR